MKTIPANVILGLQDTREHMLVLSCHGLFNVYNILAVCCASYCASSRRCERA